MNIPSFTAELSLYKSTAHYLPLKSTALQTNVGIMPTMEMIEVVSCGPGMIQFGEGADINCVNPLDLFGGGGGGGTPTPLGDGPRGGGGGGGRPPRPRTPPKPPKPPRPKPLPKTKAECQTQCKDIKTDVDWSVACDELCTCLFDTPNPATVCARDFKEDTGQDSPFQKTKPPRR